MRLLSRLWNIATVHLPILIRVEIQRRFPDLFEHARMRPTTAWLNPTDNCNMRCIMCDQWRQTKTGELTTQEWKDLITQLHDVGINKIGFNGGEPLLRKDFVEIVRHVSSLGMSPALITSGFLLDEAKLEGLISAGIKHITVSIDGVGKQYEKIRRRDWGRVEKAARLVAAAYKAGRVDVDVGFVVMKDTLSHFQGIRDFCRELGLPLMLSLVDSTPFFFKIPKNQRGADKTNWVSREDEPALRALQENLVKMKTANHYSTVNTYADIDYMSSYFRAPLQRKTPCTVSELRLMINSRGEVYGGCWSMGSYGSIREKPLKKIINSKKYRLSHKAMFYKLCPGCSCGYATNLRYSLPLQWRDRLFNLLPFLRKRIYSPETNNGKT